MQINIRAATTGDGDYTTFADSLNVISPRTNTDLIDCKPPTLKTLEQIEPLAGGAGQFVANRGNALWTMLVPIQMWYASEIAARQAVATMGAALSIGLMDLQILDAADDDAVYLPACSLGDFTPDSGTGQQGVYLKFTLKFTGNLFTTTAP
jgi:hypothetical protein